MTWRRIGVYYGLAILFGSYFVFFLWDSVGDAPKRGRNVSVQSRFLPFSEESVQQLQLQREGQVITCQKNGEIWKVVEPQGANVTSSLVSSLIESLTLERETTSVNENATDLTLYGLEPPHATITLTGKNDQELAKISIGGRNPTSTAVYVKKGGSSQVVLLGYNARYYEELLFEAATGSTAGITPTPETASPETVNAEPATQAAPTTLDTEVAERPVDAAQDATAPQAADTPQEQSVEEVAEESEDIAQDTTDATAPEAADTPSSSEAADTPQEQSVEPEEQPGE
jgi:hypothetical protein